MLYELLVAEIPGVHNAGSEILHQHVGRGDEAVMISCPQRVLRSTTIAALLRFIIRNGPPRLRSWAHRVAAGRSSRMRSDLDNVGRPCRENEVQVGARHHMSQIENLFNPDNGPIFFTLPFESVRRWRGLCRRVPLRRTC